MLLVVLYFFLLFVESDMDEASNFCPTLTCTSLGGFFFLVYSIFPRTERY